jgi:hypothetical protein
VSGFKPSRWCRLLAAVLLAVAPQSLFACATCFGASDSDLAKGMNWGILSLLTVVVVVLSGIASFFFYLVKRSAMLSAQPRGPASETSKST